MKNYIADFEQATIFDTVETVSNFKIQAVNKQDAIKQIKGWFRIVGTIRIIEAK